MQKFNTQALNGTLYWYGGGNVLEETNLNGGFKQEAFGAVVTGLPHQRDRRKYPHITKPR